jgi:tetratricopeptide (TPR) repeat protein
VQIHEVGEQDGRPFFSLEYIDGVGLPDKLAGTPQPAHEAAGLIETLARAVHYAHQRGVIHRDLKPANILLQENGPQVSHRLHVPLSSFTPKITDFGLAKRLDSDSAQTESGAIMGTPSYMAPEQAAGRTHAIGPAVDVYALGAIFYEMLTGRPPFKAETSLETVRQVVTEEPVRPTRFQRKVPRDIETICLKCLSKEPGRRYASAAGLADDLQRFLHGEPITARPTQPWELAAKWAKRRPALAGLILVSVLAVMSLATGGLWYNAHLQAALIDAREQRDKARNRFQMAREAVDQFHTKVSESAELKAKGTERLRTQLLETALAFYQRFVKEEGGADIEAERGRAFGRLGTLYHETGQDGLAEQAYQQALLIFKPLAGAHPRVVEFQEDLAQGYNQLAGLYEATGRADEAEKLALQSLESYKRLVADHPQEVKYQIQLAIGHRDLSMLYNRTARSKPAESAINAALKILNSLPEDSPGVREQLADCYHGQGIIYHTGDQRHLAEGPYQRALGIRKKLAASRPASLPDLIDSYHTLAVLYVETGRSAEAEKCHAEALPICQQLAASHPTVPVYQSLLAGIYQELGTVHLETGRYPDAESNYHRALDIQKPLAAASPEVLEYTLEMGVTYENLGLLAAKVGKPDAALQWDDKAIDALGSVLKKEPRQTEARRELGSVYSQRALIASQMGRQREVVANLDGALELAAAADKPGLRTRRALALAYLREHARAALEVSELAKDKAAAKETLYDLARVCSVASGEARQDSHLPPADREILAGKYAQSAIDLLRKARASGFFNDEIQLADMKKDKDFKPLLSNKSFNELIVTLQGQIKGNSGPGVKSPNR